MAEGTSGSTSLLSRDWRQSLASLVCRLMGTVDEIFIAPAARVEMVPVAAARAVAGLGLEGDRYFRGVGAFSRWPGEGRQVTLISGPDVAEIERQTRLVAAPGWHRRNVVVSGISLNECLGKRFRIGSALFRGERLCAPCRYLDRLVGHSVYDAMKSRGGLRAAVLESGTFGIGSDVVIASGL